MIVSVEELKAHLRIQQDAEDALLERLLHQAQATANDFCRTDFDADAPEPVRQKSLAAVCACISRFSSSLSSASC